jgi:SNF2 family DNA or RNA helicase
MGDEQQAQYEQMRKEAHAEIEGGRLDAVGVLAEITRCRQFALGCARLVIDPDGRRPDSITYTRPSNKLDWIEEFLYERRWHDGKVVIASSFTEWIEFLSGQLAAEGYPNLMLTGKTSDKARADLVRRWQRDPDDDHRVAIINTKAGGVGITLDAADDMILTDIPWKSDEEEQVTDRIHRVSRIHNVTVYRLVSRGTVDSWMAGLTEHQRQLLSRVRPDARLMAEAVA